MENGGNAALKEFLIESNVPLGNPMDYKYKTNASDYYRERLCNLIMEKPEPEKPPVDILNVVNPLLEESSNKLYDTDIPMKEDKMELVSNWFSSAGRSLSLKINDIKFDSFKEGVKEKAQLLKSKTISISEKGYESMKSLVSKKPETNAENPFLKKKNPETNEENGESGVNTNLSVEEEEKGNSKNKVIMTVEFPISPREEPPKKDKIISNFKEMNEKMKSKVEDLKIKEKFDTFKSFASEKWNSITAKNTSNGKEEEEVKEDSESKDNSKKEKIKGFFRSASMKTKEIGEDIEISTREFREKAANSTKEGFQKFKKLFSKEEESKSN